MLTRCLITEVDDKGIYDTSYEFKGAALILTILNVVLVTFLTLEITLKSSKILVCLCWASNAWPGGTPMLHLTPIFKSKDSDVHWKHRNKFEQPPRITKRSYSNYKWL